MFVCYFHHTQTHTYFLICTSVNLLVLFFRIMDCCPLNHKKFAGQIIFLCVNYYQKLQRIPSLSQSIQYYFERLYRSLRQTYDCIEWFNSFINSLQAFKLILDFSIATIFFSTNHKRFDCQNLASAVNIKHFHIPCPSRRNKRTITAFFRCPEIFFQEICCPVKTWPVHLHKPNPLMTSN